MPEPNNLFALLLVAATMLGPILAVIVTRYNDARSRGDERRSATSRTLMATRSAPLSPDHVNSLNTTEVDFHGSKEVQVALMGYIEHLNKPLAPTLQEQTKWEELRRDLLAVLLTKMALSLGISKGEIEIRRGGYYPTGWSTREARVDAAQNWIIGLATGKEVIPVKIVRNDQSAKT